MKKYRYARLLVVLLTLVNIATTSVYAAEKSLEDQPNPKTNTNPSIGLSGIRFDGQLVDHKMAEQWAEQEGYDLLRLYSCAKDGRENCLVLVVKGKKRFFQYALNDKACKKSLTKVLKNTPPEAARSEPKSTSTSGSTLTQKKKVFIPDTRCFAGYEVLYRVRTRDSAFFDAESSMISHDWTFQLSFDGKWKKVSQALESLSIMPDGGGTKTIYTAEYLDDDGNSIGADTLSTFSIASSTENETTGSIDARCGNLAEGIVTKSAKKRYWGAEICNMIQPDTIQVGEPIVAVSGNIDFCDAVDGGYAVSAAVLANEVEKQCLENPSNFLADLAKGSAPTQAFELPEEFNVGGAASNLVVDFGICPETKWLTFEMSLSNDVVCKGEAKYNCSEKDGKCNCVKAYEVRNFVCTELNP